MSTDTIRRAAELLVEAHGSGQPLAALPTELLPTTTAEAYAIQKLVSTALGPIGGWKTAPNKDGVKFNWAPIPAAGSFQAGAEILLSAFPRGALELEVGFLLRRDLPARDAPYSSKEVVAALGDMRVCLELFASRYAMRAARSPLEQLADGQNAFGVVVGSGLTDWHGLDLGRTQLGLYYAGENHTASGGRSLDDLVAACTDLANAAGPFGGLRAGQVIITGARIGPIAATSAGPVHGRIDPIGAVNAILR